MYWMSYIFIFCLFSASILLDILIIIIIIMSCCQQGYPWPSLATPPYRSSLLAGRLGYIPYPHRFELVVLLLLGHVRGSLREHHLWACPCFSSSVLHVHTQLLHNKQNEAQGQFVEHVNLGWILNFLNLLPNRS